jgi:hypothetical protein
MLATALGTMGKLRTFEGNAMRRTLTAVASFVVVIGVVAVVFISLAGLKVGWKNGASRGD